MNVFHLEVPDANTVYGTGIPSAGISSHPIVAGVVGVGTLIPPAAGSTSVTQIITTPGPTFYTNSGSGGNGDFGTIVIGATYTTTLIASGVNAAHGGTYDPHTNTVILFGDGHITQYDLTGTLVSDLAVNVGQFDQGTVDGNGHLYVANNFSGDLFFMDYSTSLLVGDGLNFISSQFLAFNLDDIGPLVGAGETDPCANLGGDTDEDGVCDDEDNCPNTANADQADADNDGVGDVCDNCVDTPNADQTDDNNNGVGDVCDFCTPDTMNLIAGQTIDAGDVTIINDGTTLFVTIETQDGWSLTESHLDFGDLIDGFPTNNKGNPKVGLFDFQESHALGTTEFTYEFLLADLGIDPLDEETIPIAIHTVVVKVEAGEIVAEETAWKQGERFVEKGNWAMFNEYTIQNCLIIQ